jgi:hypothetical protein
MTEEGKNVAHTGKKVAKAENLNKRLFEKISRKRI